MKQAEKYHFHRFFPRFKNIFKKSWDFLGNFPIFHFFEKINILEKSKILEKSRFWKFWKCFPNRGKTRGKWIFFDSNPPQFVCFDVNLSENNETSGKSTFPAIPPCSPMIIDRIDGYVSLETLSPTHSIRHSPRHSPAPSPAHLFSVNCSFSWLCCILDCRDRCETASKRFSLTRRCTLREFYRKNIWSKNIFEKIK